MSWRYGGYKPYVSVAKRRAQAAREIEKRRKKGGKVSPVVIEGRTIVSTFWGKAWCTNLEGYSDFENRLPRGRTYVRNGSVIDLKIVKGRINALVSGSEIYEIAIEITPLPANAWKAIKKLCAGKIGSLVELLQGRLSTSVMEAVTNREEGLFPKPKEIRMRCSCPDYAGMCKHIAAVMYGIGNRLDASPEMLFELRGVDHRELIEEAIPAETARAEPSVPTVQESELGAIFGIEIGDAPAAPKPPAKRAAKKAAKAAGPQPAVKAAPVKQAAPVKKAAPTRKAPAKKPVKTAGSAETKPAEAAKVKKAAASRKPAKPTSKKK